MGPRTHTRRLTLALQRGDHSGNDPRRDYLARASLINDTVPRQPRDSRECRLENELILRNERRARGVSEFTVPCRCPSLGASTGASIPPLIHWSSKKQES